MSVRVRPMPVRIRLTPVRARPMSVRVRLTLM
jgi:hypothetical protein